MTNTTANGQGSFEKNNQFSSLYQKIADNQLPADLAENLKSRLERLEREMLSTGFRVEFDLELEYINFVLSLPFTTVSQDILDLKRAAQILDENHYGLQPVKERILEYLATAILNFRQNRKMHSQVLSFVGLVGSGKTSLAYSIAESLGRKLIRIPFGGLGSVRELRGESRVKVDAEPGRIMKMLSKIGFNNPVILLDEIDRVSLESRSDIMGVLVELLDPEQNWAFVDHYVDYPFDLSNALFLTTANNLSNVATAVLDRLEVIEMPAYSDEEKIIIGRDYILPKATEEAGLNQGQITIDNNLWPQIVRPLGFDAGIRSLQRNIQAIVRKVAIKVVEGDSGHYHLTEQNISEYLGV